MHKTINKFLLRLLLSRITSLTHKKTCFRQVGQCCTQFRFFIEQKYHKLNVIEKIIMPKIKKNIKASRNNGCFRQVLNTELPALRAKEIGATWTEVLRIRYKNIETQLGPRLYVPVCKR